jgi:rod shape-determining protein MreC
VISQKTQLRGVLKGQGTPTCKVDYVPSEEKIEPGESFYTSGDDRVFPRGFPVGIVRVVRSAQPFKEIYVEPSGLKHGLEDVLILVEGVHQDIPEAPVGNQPVYMVPPPPQPAGAAKAVPAETPGVPGAGAGTEADKLRERYKAIGDAQNHKFGEGLPGSKPPNFNLQPPAPGTAAPAPAAPQTPKPQNSGRSAQPPAAPPAGSGAPNAVRPSSQSSGPVR